MPGEIEPAGASALNQLLIAAATLLSAGGVWFWQYLKGHREEPKAERIVVEAADLADMRPVRELVPLVRELGPKLDRLYGVEQEIKGEIGDAKDAFGAAFKEVNQRLERVEREQEVQRRFQEREDRRRPAV